MLIHRLFAGQMPQLVMFDLDGTLVDSVPDIVTATDAMLEELGKPAAGTDKVRVWIGNGIAKLVQRALRDAQLHEWAEDMTSPEFLRAKDLFDRAYDESCGHYSVVYDGVYECLNALKSLNVDMAVITNKSERFTGNLLQQLGLDNYFSQVVSGDTLPLRKPDPAPLIHVMTQAEVSKEHTLMVGDSRHDIAAAKAAGVQCVGVPYGYNHGEPIESFHPDLLVSSLDELILIQQS
ncbi:phosphoglycolate phosphatase [Sansalvadorimonas verongulae]|uniref:phosphoglycolate phosphatase n=1 Tax=Sansalvadorimonas verongulae TaxID=2172824 RepID=UPI0012BCC504|nr:phosphoglycolate phosphatase [Sansalvadorimonas verongulae]MTI15479.1 phosphoglycolate phosphatase [Sansalvadorimonas verongulae]